MNVSGMMKGIQEGMYVVLVLLIGLLSIVINALSKHRKKVSLKMK